MPTPGVVQVLPCQLTPKGQPGSSCSLVLAVTGNAIPKEGIHTGPILCEANSNGTPNPNQCYRPSAVNSLNITLTKPPVGVTITVNPFILLMEEHSTGTVTVTNDASSSASANNVTATIPGGSSITFKVQPVEAVLQLVQTVRLPLLQAPRKGPSQFQLKVIIPIQPMCIPQSPKSP